MGLLATLVAAVAWLAVVVVAYGLVSVLLLAYLRVPDEGGPLLVVEDAAFAVVLPFLLVVAVLRPRWIALRARFDGE